MHSDHAIETEKGFRYTFGKNWQSFLTTLNDERIQEAENSLKQLLQVNDLRGKRFLDIGSGSGIFSLAAKRLGAHVHSFDFDPDSVRCALKLKELYFKNDQSWTIEEGSALDRDYMLSLGRFDVVYSWGVLHHTGDMNRGIGLAADAVDTKGKLFVSIYNDQGFQSILWRKVKKLYCSGQAGKITISSIFFPYYALRSGVLGIIRYGNPLGYANAYKKKRGMSINHDRADWLGGYPFEVAKPEEIFEILDQKDFTLTKLVTTNRNGCNQFVFVNNN